MRTIGEFTSVQEINNLPIPTSTGAVIHLSDVAKVEQVEADRDSFTYINGEKGILLSVDKQSTANLVKVSQSLKDEIAKLQRDYPELEIDMLSDTSDYIEMSLSNITETALLAAVIAFFVPAAVPEKRSNGRYHCRFHPYVHHGNLCPDVCDGYQYEHDFHGWCRDWYRYAGR